MMQDDLNLARMAELKAKLEDERRAKDLNNKIVRASDGPAHKLHFAITQKIKSDAKEFYDRQENACNCLSKQLKDSELEGIRRSHSDSKYLMKDWNYNIAAKEQRALEFKKWTEKVGLDMKKIIQKNIEDEEKLRETRRQNGIKYQQDLDNQLKTIRNKTLAGLKGYLYINYTIY
jgi:hypothetical protein